MQIDLKIPEDVTVNLIRVGFVCKKCFKTWGVYLTPEFKMPYRGDKCSKCSNMEIEENVNTDRKNNI